MQIIYIQCKTFLPLYSICFQTLQTRIISVEFVHSCCINLTTYQSILSLHRAFPNVKHINNAHESDYHSSVSTLSETASFKQVDTFLALFPSSTEMCLSFGYLLTAPLPDTVLSVCPHIDKLTYPAGKCLLWNATSLSKRNVECVLLDFRGPPVPFNVECMVQCRKA